MATKALTKAQKTRRRSPKVEPHVPQASTIAGKMTKMELAEEVRRYREAERQTIKDGTPLLRQRLGTNWLSTHILEDLVGSDGQGGMDSLYGVLREQAFGQMEPARCHERQCDNSGGQVQCDVCGVAPIQVVGRNWQAALRLVELLVPKPSTSQEALQEEFLEWIGRVVIDAFDLANGESDPTARKDAFIAHLDQLMAGAASAADNAGLEG